VIKFMPIGGDVKRAFRRAGVDELMRRDSRLS
jgi:hypothetical protein